jgi:hypothetical protein
MGSGIIETSGSCVARSMKKAGWMQRDFTSLDPTVDTLWALDLTLEKSAGHLVPAEMARSRGLRPSSIGSSCPDALSVRMLSQSWRSVTV